MTSSPSVASSAARHSGVYLPNLRSSAAPAGPYHVVPRQPVTKPQELLPATYVPRSSAHSSKASRPYTYECSCACGAMPCACGKTPDAIIVPATCVEWSDSVELDAVTRPVSSL